MRLLVGREGVQGEGNVEVGRSMAEAPIPDQCFIRVLVRVIRSKIKHLVVCRGTQLQA